MKKELKIKVCGMRNPENVQEISESNPDFFGFIFYPKSKRYVGENPDLMFLTQLNSSIKKAAVFVNEEEAEVVRLCRTYGFEIAQLHGSESVNYCRKIRNQGLTVFKAFSIDEGFNFSQLDAYQDAVDFFLFDTKGKLPGGTGQKFNWNILNNYQLQIPFFLSGGIAPEDLTAILEFEHPAIYGVDINSGFEIEPALKDVNKVRRFINELK